MSRPLAPVGLFSALLGSVPQGARARLPVQPAVKDVFYAKNRSRDICVTQSPFGRFVRAELPHIGGEARSSLYLISRPTFSPHLGDATTTTSVFDSLRYADQLIVAWAHNNGPGYNNPPTQAWVLDPIASSSTPGLRKPSPFDVEWKFPPTQTTVHALPLQNSPAGISALHFVYTVDQRRNGSAAQKPKDMAGAILMVIAAKQDQTYIDESGEYIYHPEDVLFVVDQIADEASMDPQPLDGMIDELDRRWLGATLGALPHELKANLWNTLVLRGLIRETSKGQVIRPDIERTLPWQVFAKHPPLRHTQLQNNETSYQFMRPVDDRGLLVLVAIDRKNGKVRFPADNDDEPIRVYLKNGLFGDPRKTYKITAKHIEELESGNFKVRTAQGTLWLDPHGKILCFTKTGSQPQNLSYFPPEVLFDGKESNRAGWGNQLQYVLGISKDQLD